MADTGVEIKDLRQFLSKSGRGYWICPRSGKESDELRQLILRVFRGRIIWNESRLCYVLPRPEGLKFREMTEGKKEEKDIEREQDGVLSIFPNHQKFTYGHDVAQLRWRSDSEIQEMKKKLAALELENKKLKETHEQMATLLHNFRPRQSSPSTPLHEGAVPEQLSDDYGNI